MAVHISVLHHPLNVPRIANAIARLTEVYNLVHISESDRK